MRSSGDLRGITASPEVQALPGQLAQTLAEIDATVTEVRTLLEQVREAEAVTRVLAAVDSANAALTSVAAATRACPSSSPTSTPWPSRRRGSRSSRS
jgi:paraquat-inducible protein B